MSPKALRLRKRPPAWCHAHHNGIISFLHSILKLFLHRSNEEYLLSQAKHLFSRLISNLLQLTQLTLLARLTNDTDTINTSLLTPLAVTVNDKHDKRADVLELDEAESDVGSAVAVPVLILELNRLSSLNIVGLVETENVRLVAVKLDGLWTHRDLVVVLIGIDCWCKGGDLLLVSVC